MKLGFDAKRYFNNQTGLGNYSRTLLANLQAFAPEHEYFLYSPSIGLNHEKEKIAHHANVTVRTAGTKNKTIWRSFEIKEDIAADKLDIYHGLSHELPRNNDHMKCKKVVTIHDLIFKTRSEYFPVVDRTFYHIKCKHSLNTADKIVAISEHTKKDIVQHYNVDADRIEVIYQSCLPQYYVKDPFGSNRLPKTFPSEYNLSVGSIEARKNSSSVIKAYSLIPPKERIPLFLIGNGKKHKKSVQKQINRLHLQKDIHILSNVSTHLLPAIYRHATMMIYPSFYEGFGLPVAEALLSNTPVVTSNNSSLPEAGGPDSWYVDPTSVEEIAQAISTIQNDTELAKKMATKGKAYALQTFDPKSLTKQMLQLYAGLVD